MQKQENNKINRGAKDRSWLRRPLFFCGSAVYLELALHFFVFRAADLHIVYPVLFGLLSGASCALLTGLLPRVPRRILAVLLVLVQCLLAEIQLIYHAVFGNLMPISQLQMGGGVIGNFLDQTLYAIRQNLGAVAALLLPLLALLLCLALKKAPRERASGRQSLAILGALVLLAALTLGLMHVVCAHPVPVWRLFHSAGTSTDQSYRSVGMSATTVQELRYLLLPARTENSLLPAEDPEGGSAAYDPERWNVLPELDFKALAASAEDEKLRELDLYFAAAKPTEKNEYTGLLAGYNVIELCAESYCPWFVSPELTPTLYRMSHSGIIFENYYGCFNSMTTNGEYTLCLGLLPDMTRIKSQSSFDESVGHYLPFCLGTCLKDYGYATWAYHNNNGEFYNRSLTHPNMGYRFKAQGSGLHVTKQRPASDLEMIEQSVEDYLRSDKPFHAYYMTYSGHYHYSWTNAMSAKHRAEVEGLPYSETVKAYIACNLELEAALSCLEQKLSEAGKLDRTVILLTNDHYPYGLSAEEYNELAGREVDVQFEKYRNHLICYVPGLGRDIRVEEYCSTLDVLPTLLNLLGVRYDSRLLPGTDVFAPGRHAAILHDGSVVTERLRYAESSGELIWAEGVQADEAEAEALRRWAADRFTISREILDTDYYAHAFPEGQAGVAAEESMPFDDTTNVRVQGNCLFIYRKGLMDLYAERSFAPFEPATVGDWVTAVYRYSGQPAADEEALPTPYPAADPAAQAAFRDSPQHDAVCWAFAEGLLRPEDRMTDYSAPLDNPAICLMLWRTTALLGLMDPAVGPDAEALIPENGAWLTGEDRQAVAWALEHKMIAGDRETGTTLFANIPENYVNRYRIALFLMKLFYPEMTT